MKSPKIHLPRQVSENIGWGPATMPSSLEEEEEKVTGRTRRTKSLYQSMSDVGSKMYRPLSSFTSSILSSASSSSPPPPTWKVVGTTLKLIGLGAFFAGDNLSYLSSFGFLDAPFYPPQYTQTKDGEKMVLQQRNNQKMKLTHFTMRTYFMTSIVGFFLNWNNFWNNWNDTLKEKLDQIQSLERQLKEERNDKSEKKKKQVLELEKQKKLWEDIKGKQFVLLLALLKSCLDIIIFSNNPGVDLHAKYRGKKLNEGFHSICGILSASTVIYNNFPNAETK